MIRTLLPFLLVSLFFISCNQVRQVDPISNSQWKAFYYLPNDTHFLLYLNLKNLRNTSYFESFIKPQLSESKENNWIEKFEAATGIGFRKGVSELFTATTWDNNNVFVVGYEPVYYSKVKAYFSDGNTFNNEKGIFRLRDKNARFYLPDDSTIVLFNTDKYQEQIQLNKSLKENKKFIGIISEIGNKKEYWIATNQSMFAYTLVKRIAGERTKDAAELLKSIKEVSLSATFTEGIELDSRWRCRNMKDAVLFSSAIRTALDMDLLSGKNYEMNEILKQTEVDRQGNVVNLNLNLSDNDIKQLKGIAKDIPGKNL